MIFLAEKICFVQKMYEGTSSVCLVIWRTVRSFCGRCVRIPLLTFSLNVLACTSLLLQDVWAYRAVGIPIFRIFTINHRGELKHELTQTFQSS
jgi:hypothetical protein